MVFQSYALYPHMTVRNNIGFGLRMAGVPKAERDAKVEEAAALLNLTPYLDRRPGALSGGQRQRVAIGRAIVRQPKAFLFDEPLSNLDAALRVNMRLEIARLQNSLGTTAIYVTHDQVEAMTMADKIVVLNAGKVEQVGSPLELYIAARQPLRRRLHRLAEDEPRSPARSPTTLGAKTIGVRPEHLRLSRDGNDGWPGIVQVAEHLGSDTFLYVDVPGAGLLTVRARGRAQSVAGRCDAPAARPGAHPPLRRERLGAAHERAADRTRRPSCEPRRMIRLSPTSIAELQHDEDPPCILRS